MNLGPALAVSAIVARLPCIPFLLPPILKDPVSTPPHTAYVIAGPPCPSPQLQGQGKSTRSLQSLAQRKPVIDMA